MHQHFGSPFSVCVVARPGSLIREMYPLAAP
nr:MAG TPA: hypothetical protein [Caudoviricetes sp.]